MKLYTAEGAPLSVMGGESWHIREATDAEVLVHKAVRPLWDVLHGVEELLQERELVAHAPSVADIRRETLRLVVRVLKEAPSA